MTSPDEIERPDLERLRGLANESKMSADGSLAYSLLNDCAKRLEDTAGYISALEAELEEAEGRVGRKQECMDIATCLTPEEFRMCLAWADCCSDYSILSFKHISERSGLDIERVGPIARGMKENGLLTYNRSSMMEDGQVYGAGYAPTDKLWLSIQIAGAVLEEPTRTALKEPTHD
jgi:hypothetical protein